MAGAPSHSDGVGSPTGPNDPGFVPEYLLRRLEPNMSRTLSLVVRLAGLAAFALVLAAPFRWF